MPKNSLQKTSAQLKKDLQTLVAVARRTERASREIEKQLKHLGKAAGGAGRVARKKNYKGKKRGVPVGTIRSPKTQAILDAVKRAKKPISPSQVKAILDKRKLTLTLSGVNQVMNRLSQIKKVGRGLYVYEG